MFEGIENQITAVTSATRCPRDFLPGCSLSECSMGEALALLFAVRPWWATHCPAASCRSQSRCSLGFCSQKLEGTFPRMKSWGRAGGEVDNERSTDCTLFGESPSLGPGLAISSWNNKHLPAQGARSHPIDDLSQYPLASFHYEFTRRV